MCEMAAILSRPQCVNTHPCVSSCLWVNFVLKGDIKAQFSSCCFINRREWWLLCHESQDYSFFPWLHGIHNERVCAIMTRPSIIAILMMADQGRQRLKSANTRQYDLLNLLPCGWRGYVISWAHLSASLSLVNTIIHQISVRIIKLS